MHKDLQKRSVKWSVSFQMVLYFFQDLDSFVFLKQKDRRQPARRRIILERKNYESPRHDELIITSCVFTINCLFNSNPIRDM